MKNRINKSISAVKCLPLLVIVLLISISCDDQKDRPMLPEFSGEVSALFLAGTSTNKLVSLNLATNDGNVYTYDGVLNSGDLYFQTEKGSNVNVFRKGETENSIALNSSESFAVAYKGFYKVVINVENKTIEMTSTKLDNTLYMVGPPVDTWSGLQAAPVVCTEAEPFVYTYTHFFFGGIYKFLLQKDNLLAKLVPDKDSKAPRFFATEEDLVAAGYDAENWNLETEGDYTITVDLVQNKVNVQPTTFYPNRVDSIFIVGNKYGWDMQRGATPLIKDSTTDGVFYITDDFDAGEFKFLLQRNNFRPAIVKVSDTEIVYMISPSGDQDKKWNITTPGNYTVRLNIKNNSISIVKN